MVRVSGAAWTEAILGRIAAPVPEVTVQAASGRSVKLLGRDTCAG